MIVQRVPAGWAPEQLAALNELAGYAEALTLVNQVLNATGDTTPEAAKVKADLVTEARTVWARVKTYPAPAV